MLAAFFSARSSLRVLNARLAARVAPGSAFSTRRTQKSIVPEDGLAMENGKRAEKWAEENERELRRRRRSEREKARKRKSGSGSERKRQSERDHCRRNGVYVQDPGAVEKTCGNFVGDEASCRLPAAAKGIEVNVSQIDLPTLCILGSRDGIGARGFGALLGGLPRGRVPEDLTAKQIGARWQTLTKWEWICGPFRS